MTDAIEAKAREIAREFHAELVRWSGGSCDGDGCATCDKVIAAALTTFATTLLGEQETQFAALYTEQQTAALAYVKTLEEQVAALRAELTTREDDVAMLLAEAQTAREGFNILLPAINQISAVRPSQAGNLAGRRKARECRDIAAAALVELRALAAPDAVS